MSEPVRIAVFGATGRMGRSVIASLGDFPDLTLVGALAGPEGEGGGADAGTLAGVDELGVVLSPDRSEVVRGAQVAIDFTLPGAVPGNLRACREAGVACVSGVTGLDAPALHAMEEAAGHIPVLWAPNMSTGVAVLTRAAQMAAKALGDGFDVEILEIHHAAKRDAPSGTALALGAAVARARGLDPQAAAVIGRQGPGERQAGSIGYASLRAGDVAGEHTVVLAGPGERLELSHRATDRKIFARGALTAARWLAGQGPGRYELGDVLGLESMDT
ncbi:MAG: 4-hydroxy-tetrahydrodipicolinate reductase [Gammaproteobacteria bacterium]